MKQVKPGKNQVKHDENPMEPSKTRFNQVKRSKNQFDHVKLDDIMYEIRKTR